ncbi:MAG: hypothetical protein Q8P36_00815 [bacterium]|nr:hypothetical protein [bacterium]
MMTSPDLAELARRARSMREAGLALIIASGVLALFLFIPLTPERQVSDANGVATTTTAVFTVAPLEAQAAIVYDLATGEILYEKSADAQLPLASLTKLLTVYAALTKLSPTTPITISREAARAEYPHVFKAGQTFMFADIARLTLTGSLNDGAAAIAETVAAREGRSTSDMLAAAAAALDLSATYAVNGSGLDMNTAVSGGYGSAHDVARLAGALVQAAPDIAFATTLGATEARSVSGTVYRVKNTNPIAETVPRLLLSKTGYTDLAGGNLALIFDAGITHPVAIVVLGSSKDSRFTDGMALVAATLAYFAELSSL